MTSVATFTEDEAPTQSLLQDDSQGASERQRSLLQACLGHLDDFLPRADVPEGVVGPLHDDFDVVVGAEKLRAAADCLAKGNVGKLGKLLRDIETLQCQLSCWC